MLSKGWKEKDILQLFAETFYDAVLAHFEEIKSSRDKEKQDYKEVPSKQITIKR